MQWATLRGLSAGYITTYDIMQLDIINLLVAAWGSSWTEGHAHIFQRQSNNCCINFHRPGCLRPFQQRIFLETVANFFRFIVRFSHMRSCTVGNESKQSCIQSDIYRAGLVVDGFSHACVSSHTAISVSKWANILKMFFWCCHGCTCTVSLCVLGSVGYDFMEKSLAKGMKG